MRRRLHNRTQRASMSRCPQVPGAAWRSKSHHSLQGHSRVWARRNTPNNSDRPSHDHTVLRLRRRSSRPAARSTRWFDIEPYLTIIHALVLSAAQKVRQKRSCRMDYSSTASPQHPSSSQHSLAAGCSTQQLPSSPQHSTRGSSTGGPPQAKAGETLTKSTRNTATIVSSKSLMIELLVFFVFREQPRAMPKVRLPLHHRGGADGFGA
jgi:hypothetical protein